ncbi:MAG: class I tRNA ligase family protein, partial [Myxococcota bacterium]
MSEPTEGPTHRYDASLADRIEKKWQAHWEQHQTFRQLDPKDEGFDASRPKFYCLDMFPYPSGAGLHVGHPEGYTATDIVSRYKRMRGYNVLHPMGWDAFGLPAEQYAIKTGVHPSITTKDAINNFRRQLQRFGFSYDWSREFATTDPEYYRWTQWIFLKIYGSWFDPEQQKARPIEVLEAAFADGSRPVRLNPRAAEFSREEKDQDLGAWSALSPSEQRRVTDSYRLAYKAPAPVNWCPKLGTVLANEEVIDGRSERGDYPVYRKTLPQWTFRIAEYSDRFLAGLDDLDWPKPTKLKQTEWIGRSYGAEADFPVEGAPGGFASLRIYTTRPDTLFGATYMVVAPEHGIVDAFLANPTQETNADSVRAYVEAARNRSDRERQQSKDKTGVFSGHYATNPVNGERIPVWVADYVLMGYGHGAIMAVPAHDERDFEFAKKFDLRIVEVLKAPKGSAPVECFAGNGTAVNSKNDDVSLDGLPTAEAKTRIIEWLTSQGIGRGHTNYRLRDWVFSRQRYWGEPFPVVFDEEGHHHPVDEDALPLNLPELEDYAPVENDEPQALLDKVTDWITVTAGEAHVSSLPADAKVVRETNTMPGWAGSCWYHLRYCDPRNADALVSQEADAYWMGEDGVDLYVGGAEHAVLHLLYARFWHMVLYDYGYVKSPEPYRKLFHQGLIMSYAYRGPDKRLLAVDTVRNEGTEEEPKFVSTETGDEVEQITAKMSKNLKN